MRRLIVLSTLITGCVAQQLPREARPLNDVERQAVARALGEWAANEELAPCDEACAEAVQATPIAYLAQVDVDWWCGAPEGVHVASCLSTVGLFVVRDTLPSGTKVSYEVALAHEALHKVSEEVYGDSDRDHLKGGIWSVTLERVWRDVTWEGL